VPRFMQQSKIWKKIKKPLLVGFYIVASLVVCFASLHATDGGAEEIFFEILSAFSALAIFATALSIALFNYIDNISKDLSAVQGDANKISKALGRLSVLKKEVIVNAGLILTLLVLELALKGVSKSISPDKTPFQSFYWVVFSLRFSFFTLAILAVSEQIRGLLVAIDYRNVIHAGKSSNK
jgi:drug/metabolite transporter (DMT)-like permease